MKEAHLVLNLTLHKQDGTSEDIILELSKDELDHFINTLEKAQKVILISFYFSFNFHSNFYCKTVNVLRA